METMYDRLGDLLKETLEAGHVKFVKTEAPHRDAEDPADAGAAQTEDAPPAGGAAASSAEGPARGTERARTNAFSGGQGSRHKRTAKVIRYISPEIESACRMLGVSFNSTKSEIRKAYKEKLKYFHPDKYENNPALKQVATNKTRYIVDAYNLLIKSF